ncbi:hypothetical protein [Granulicatella adiacens]|uniref:hypothetical protein n=1 Tax=Granulicatella adiacens TaxID=46124 RepID=UPI00241EF77B|nr:hypothetical protein [Granulicatella adiacens]
MMKKVFIFIAIVIGIFAVVQCSKPTLTKKQQDNVAILIYRNYDIQEIDFLDFDKNLSTGNYELALKLNNDENKETIITIDDIEFFDESEGELFLNPLGRFKEYKRQRILEGEVQLSKIKIKYLGEK